MDYMYLPETDAPLTSTTVPVYPLIFAAVCLIPALLIGLWKLTEVSAHQCFLAGLRFFAIGFGYAGFWSTTWRPKIRDRDLEAEADDDGCGGDESGLEIFASARRWDEEDSGSDVSELDLGDGRGILDSKAGKDEEDGWS
ncbi:hypothetical protein F4804DRAFT_331168 [Jackrogersella minutella]|nr:hypothetical protein F4804DRAFT_331168 [Jackrogersella minutella]